MRNPGNPALLNHLRRYGSISDDGDDDKTENSSSESPDIDDTATSEDQYFLSPIVTWLFHLQGDIETNGLTQWWQRNRSFILEFARKYGALLMAFILPFTPRAARQAGYRGASHSVFRALDRLDASLPGGGQGWSKRWLSRPRRRPDARVRGGCPIDGQVGSVGVAAAAVVLAAVSWCSWRRSSPSWPMLLLELACGSTWAANYVAREDGRREAKLLESRLTSLENSLAPFFREIETCTRMVKCAQALSFGLRLSVPMPPVARMENHLSIAHDVAERERGAMALRDVRAVLLDAIQGGIDQADACRLVRCSGSQESESKCGNLGEDGGGGETNAGQKSLLLVCVAKAENQLVGNLRRFISELADRIDEAIAGPEEWGLWWESRLMDASDAVRDMVEYLDAASLRLEMAIGCVSPFFTPKDENKDTSDLPALAETISALRLRYEEIVVRLFVCQDRVQTILRDQDRSTEEMSRAVRQALGDAVESVEATGTAEDLWSKAKSLVKQGTDTSQPANGALPATPERRPDPTRVLETGVGWVSLSTPRTEGPGLFEGGDGEQGGEKDPSAPADLQVTDVLVGVASPSRNRLEGKDDNGPFRTAPGEVKAEQTRSQLLGELGSVLRGRPLPPTCEKRLPLESQQSLEGDDDGDEEPSHMKDADLSLPVPSDTESNRPPVAIFQNAGSQDLLSELRAQISLAVNEEIFSGQDRWTTVENDTEEDNILVQEKGSQLADARARQTCDTTR